MATTRSRPPHGREQARHATGGAAAEHAGKIYAVAISGAIVIVAFLALTSIGHVIDAAVQHFMLFYAGVFALIGLCASVGLGLVATDRMVLGPGHRVVVQSAHRVVSFGALGFLVIHIVTEILAQRVHVIDAFIPFLSPFRTFYIGLGTIASDLILLIVITSIVRKRFTAKGNAWKWRAIHYASYASFVFGVWHGLLAGRPGKPYVDWSYGFVVAFVALGLGVRILSNSLRPKEALSSAPVPESRMGSGSAPLRAAAMFAQLKVVRDRVTGGEMAGAAIAGHVTGPRLVSGGRFEALPASSRRTGAMPVTATLNAPTMEQAVTNLAPGSRTGEHPVYEPGYVGPARYQGAPRNPSTGPMPRPGTGPMPRPGTGPLPRAGTGPLPRPGTGPMPRAGTGPLPRPGTGPMPRPGTGPMPRPTTGPPPRAATGPMPAAANPPWDGAMPELDPRLRNREPGPGMPGYRGSAPRGADPYATDPYAHDLHSADQYSANRYSADQYSANQYTADPYQNGDGYGRNGHEPNFYGRDGYGWDGRQ